jgi:predicted Zn-ribbon and HTH transcriptional regulator
MCDKCKKCNGVMKEGIALINTTFSSEDFGGDAKSIGSTMNNSGKAVLIRCLKCKDCGHSIKR